jgi:DNA polymerase III subunit delta
VPADSIMEYERLFGELKAKRFKPIYLLHGDEAYFIDQIVDYIEQHALNEMEKAFNLSILYAKDVEISQVIESAKRYPMMANHQVIIVKEAQFFKKIDEFESYFEHPVPTTILVIAVKGKKVDGRSKLYKLAQKHVCFEAKKLYEDSELPRWIKQYLKAHQKDISDANCMLIADHVGSDLSKVANELDKLLINTENESEISEALIEQQIGISKEFNVFELMGALAHRNSKRVFYINHHLSGNKEFSIIPLLTQMNSFFMKAIVMKQQNIRDQKAMAAIGVRFPQSRDYEKLLANYGVLELEHIMKLISEYDLKSKGFNQSSVEDSELMKELLFKILYRPQLEPM